MRKLKNIVTLLLALILFACSFSVCTLAAEESAPGYVLVNTYDEENGTVTTELYVSGGRAGVGQVGVDYDENLLVLINKSGETSFKSISDIVTENGVFVTAETNKISDLVNEEKGEFFFAWYVGGLDKYVEAEKEKVKIASFSFKLAEGKTFADLGAKGAEIIKFSENAPSDASVKGYASGVYCANEKNTAFRNGIEGVNEIALSVSFSENFGISTFVNPFMDVTEADWYYSAVEFAVSEGLFNGVSDTSFAPNANINRAMLVTVLYRYVGEPAVNKSAPFSDVSMDAYYANAVIWAKQNGIVNGVTESEFAPDTSLSREQLATILYRFAGSYLKIETAASGDLEKFTDSAKIAPYAQDAVKWAVGEGLITGMTDVELAPQGTATRAQVATILKRFIEKL